MPSHTMEEHMVFRKFDPHSVCIGDSTCDVRYTRLENQSRESASACPHIQHPLAGLEGGSPYDFLHSGLHIVWDWLPKAVVIVIEEFLLCYIVRNPTLSDGLFGSRRVPPGYFTLVNGSQGWVWRSLNDSVVQGAVSS